MAEYIPSPYRLSSNRDPKGQSRRAIDETSGLIRNMLKGTDPNDDALFYKRLEDARGSQLSNRGLSSTLDARDLMATNPDYINQILHTMGLDPTKVDQGRMGDFGTFAAQTDNPLNVAGSLSTLGRGSAATAKEAEALAQSKLMNPELLRNLKLAGENLRSTGALTDQQTFNAEDFAIERGELNTQELLLRDAQKKKVQQETANLLAGMGLKKTESGADVGLTKEQTAQVKTLTDPKKALLEAQALVPKASAAAITAESAEEVNLLKSKITVQNATRWLQASRAAAERSGIRNKNAESAEKVSLLQAQTGVFGEQSNAIIAAIANKNYESALRGMKTASEALATTLESGAKVDATRQQIKVLKQEVLNLQAEQGNKNKESGARVKLTDGKVDLTSAITTQTQVETFDDSNLTKAKTNLVGAKEQGELADIAATMTGTGTGKGKAQHDFRKTEAFQRVGRNIADEGVAYTGTKPADEWFGDDLEEFTTHVWPDDDKKLRALMLPFPTDKAEQAKRMEAGKLFLRKAGDYDKDSQRIILKSILQVK